MTCETTGQDRNLPCHLPTPLAVPRIHREYENVDQTTRPTDRPTDRYPISSLFFLCLNHSSFIIHSSYLHPLTMNNDWPPDSVPSKGITRSVRSSVTRRRTGRKWTRFSALVCRYTTADCTKMVLFSVWWAGRKASSSGSGSGSR